MHLRLLVGPLHARQFNDVVGVVRVAAYRLPPLAHLLLGFTGLRWRPQKSRRVPSRVQGNIGHGSHRLVPVGGHRLGQGRLELIGGVLSLPLWAPRLHLLPP